MFSLKFRLCGSHLTIEQKLIFAKKVAYLGKSDGTFRNYLNSRRWTCDCQLISKRKTIFNLRIRLYLTCGGNSKAAWFCKVLGRRVRGSESGFKSKNKQGNRDSEFTYCLRSPSFPRKEVVLFTGTRIISANTKPRITWHKIASAFAHSPDLPPPPSPLPSYSLFPAGALTNLYPE